MSFECTWAEGLLVETFLVNKLFFVVNVLRAASAADDYGDKT